MSVKISDFIEAPNSGGKWPKVLLVVHLTISPEVKGAARGVVAFWNRGRTGSTQYVVDAAEVIQAVRETAYSWSAGTTANKWGIHTELCGFLQTLRQWRDDYSTAELERAAALQAELAGKYGIPIRWLTVEQIRHAVKTGNPADGGLCTHADITKAFPGETTHTDPGVSFPKGQFLRLVKAAAAPVKPAPKSDEFTVITANIRHALEAAAVKETIEVLTADDTDANIIALQEMGGRRRHLTIPGWEDVLVDLPGIVGEGANPLLVRESTFTVKREEVVQVTDRAVVPARAAGPSNLPPYFFIHGPLLHNGSRRTVHAICLHMPASQQIEEMRALADAAAIRLAEYVEDLRGQIILLGDWNTTRPLDLGDGALRKAGFTDVSDELGSRVTHPPTRRDIDRVLHRGDHIEPVGQRLIKGLPSDHLPRRVRFTITRKES